MAMSLNASMPIIVILLENEPVLKRNLKRFYWAIFLMTLAGAPKLKTRECVQC